MKTIPKQDIYKIPEGYFNHLPERIIRAKKIKTRKIVLSQWLAAAVLVIGLAIFVYQPNLPETITLQSAMDLEVEFYINSGYWGAEDVISFSENPDGLLDIIIEEEWSGYLINEDQWSEEDLNY